MENPEDARKWEIEAKAIIRDIKNHVYDAHISSSLPNSLSGIYFNVETLEHKRFTIKLAGNGFQVVGSDFNSEDLQNETWYETPQSLMSSISRGFVISFGLELSEKLGKLANERKDSS